MNDNYFVKFYQFKQWLDSKHLKVSFFSTYPLLVTQKRKNLSTHLLSRQTISLLVPTNIIRLHLSATGEDNKEEVGGDQPAGQIEHQVQGGQAEGCLEHIEKVHDQANAIKNQPRPHVAGIFLQKNLKSES